MNRTLLTRVGVGAVVVILLAFAVYKGVTRPKGSDAGDQTQADASTSPIVKATPVPVEYAKPDSDWKTFATASMPFTISYPKDWIAGSCGEGCIGFAAPDKPTEFLLGVGVSTTKLADVLTQAEPYQVEKKEVKPNGVTWTKLTLQQPQTGATFVSHFTEHSGSTYEFGMGAADPAIVAIYGKMIQSFTFTR